MGVSTAQVFFTSLQLQLQLQPQLVPQWSKQTLLLEASLTGPSAPSHHYIVAVLFENTVCFSLGRLQRGFQCFNFQEWKKKKKEEAD